jgi:uncharacterized protein (TIGR00369 family)
MTNDELAPQPASESRVILSMLMNPEHANPYGNVHGGVIMKLADEAGGLAAMRHSRSPVLTVAIDSMSFDQPIFVGNLITLTAELTYVGRTSMEVRVSVTAEDPLSRSISHTNLAYLVYVAVDAQGQPRLAPPLLCETPEELLRFEQARERQAERRKQRQREQILRDAAVESDNGDGEVR